MSSNVNWLDWGGKEQRLISSGRRKRTDGQSGGQERPVRSPSTDFGIPHRSTCPAGHPSPGRYCMSFREQRQAWHLSVASVNPTASSRARLLHPTDPARGQIVLS